jgi:hypothetical protein
MAQGAIPQAWGTYTPSEKTSSQLFLEALPLINAGSVGLLDHRRLLDQLIGLERRTAFGTGRDTVGHPPGAHDDVAVSAAGAILLATAKRPVHALVFVWVLAPSPTATSSLNCHAHFWPEMSTVTSC